MNKFFKSVLLLSLSAFLLGGCTQRADGEGMLRAEAYKAIALSQASKAELDFSKDKTLMPYVDLLVSKGILKDKPSQEKLEGFLTFREIKKMTEDLKDFPQLSDWLKDKDSSRRVMEEEFYHFYDLWCSRMNAKGYVKEFEDIVFHVDLYNGMNDIQSDKPVQTRTHTLNHGIFYCRDAKFMDGLLDKRLQIFVAGDEIIYIRAVLDHEADYENILINWIEEDQLYITIREQSRAITISPQVEIPEIAEGTIADIHLTDSRIDALVLKGRRATGKVLAVGKDYIEIEGVGMVQVANSFVAYAQDANVDSGLQSIRIGENVYEFYLDDSKLQAAMQKGEYLAQNIRVLIMNNHYSKMYHYTISLSSDAELSIRNGSEERIVAPGETFSLANSDESLSNTGRLIIESKDNAPIRVDSLVRGQGIPSYTGRLEIIKRDDVLYLINEQDIETYLKHVVASEVPSTFELEALKAQAVCARTYAYAHLVAGGKLNEYGAHVDDSVNYQVYNNYPRTAKADQAVDETKGVVMRYQGELVNALFYSTSCGIGTEESIWGGTSQYPYLNSSTITPEKRIVNFENEEEFVRFIHSEQEDAYEKDYPYYRWNMTVNSKNLRNRIPEVGEIRDIVVTKRGQGGIAESIKVYGSEQNLVIGGQHEIRYRLGQEEMDLLVRGGKSMKWRSALPSAFIALYSEKLSDGSVDFHIRGGGYGHGVGLSQNAAQEMAKRGMSYRQILEYFYQDAQVQ